VTTEIEMGQKDQDEFRRALARAFDNPLAAEDILSRIDFPRGRLPVWVGLNPEQWWIYVFRELDHGIVAEPNRRLLKAALGFYEHNKIFLPLARRYGLVVPDDAPIVDSSAPGAEVSASGKRSGGSDAAGGARGSSFSSRIRSVRLVFAIAVIVALAGAVAIILSAQDDGGGGASTGGGHGEKPAVTEYATHISNTGAGAVTPGPGGDLRLTEYAIPTSNSGPGSITLGPDGALWFTEQSADKVGRITPDGQRIDEFPLPRGSDPAVVVAWPNDYLSVLESAHGGGTGPQKIARLAPSGVIAEFSLPAGANVIGLADGNDGNIWFSEFAYNRIGRMDADGRITGEFPIPTPDSGPSSIVLGADGNLWFDEQKGHKIARITHAGEVAEFPYTAPYVPGTQNNHNPTAGPDGNVWFTDFWNSRIGRVTPGGDVREYAIPTVPGVPRGIVAGADGGIWFTECVPDPGRQYCAGGSKIGRSTPQGSITEYDLPNPTDGPADITVARDGDIWFTEEQGNKIGRFNLK
jgi:virginiamycin B lyase